jgi:hypothetical protein
MNTMKRVEQDVEGFYSSAIELTEDDEVKGIFATLLKDKQESIGALKVICESLQCGSSALEGAKPEDLIFLSSLAETAFYKQAGDPSRLADPGLRVKHLVDNALKLEKDLLLFYIKFFGVSCAEHRPMMSDLMRRGEQHIGELTNIKVRLARP